MEFLGLYERGASIRVVFETGTVQVSKNGAPLGASVNAPVSLGGGLSYLDLVGDDVAISGPLVLVVSTGSKYLLQIRSLVGEVSSSTQRHLTATGQMLSDKVEETRLEVGGSKRAVLSELQTVRQQTRRKPT